MLVAFLSSSRREREISAESECIAVIAEVTKPLTTFVETHFVVYKALDVRRVDGFPSYKSLVPLDSNESKTMQARNLTWTFRARENITSQLLKTLIP